METGFIRKSAQIGVIPFCSEALGPREPGTTISFLIGALPIRIWAIDVYIGLYYGPKLFLLRFAKFFRLPSLWALADPI